VALLGRAIGGEWAEIVTLALAALLLVGLAWAWWRERRSRTLPLYAVGMTLVVTTLVAPRTSMVNQVSLLLPLFLFFVDLTRRCRRGRPTVAVIQVVLLVGMWAIDLLGFPSLSSGEHWHAQQRVISPILPILLLIVLATRPRWVRKEAYGP
jgi:hypothetical protein